MAPKGVRESGSLRHVALLRGVNVGGKKVKMARLKQAFEDLGFANVRTLINSGNVVFDAAAGGTLIPTIEHKLLETFGFEIRVLVRTQDAIRSLVASQPFKGAGADTKSFVTFTGPLSGEVCSVIALDAKTTDLMTQLQKQHGQGITTRNWNTVVKLAAL
jgi:uncharacterized protein (DUF1697 family)